MPQYKQPLRWRQTVFIYSRNLHIYDEKQRTRVENPDNCVYAYPAVHKSFTINTVKTPVGFANFRNNYLRSYIEMPALRQTRGMTNPNLSPARYVSECPYELLHLRPSPAYPLQA